MQTAKIAIMTAVNEPFEVREYPLTPAPAGMAQMKLIASGVCGTDLHIWRGKIPTNPPTGIGHEFVGKVTAIAAEDGAKYGIAVGDNVVVDIACPCGECLLCRTGDDANCLRMGVTNGGNPDVAPHFYGGYGEYNYSPVKNLIRIPDALDPKMVCVFACAGPTALHAFRLAKEAACPVEKAQVAVVQGLGPVGSFAVMYLATLGIPHIIAVTGRKETNRAASAMKLGATEVIDLEDGGETLKNRVAQLSGGIGADVVFEASGNPKAVPQGMNLLRNRGTYLIPGQYSNSGDVEIPPQKITFNALRLIGSSQYSVSDVENYLAFLQKNPQLHGLISDMITAYPVAEVNKALDDAAKGCNVKTILV
jgi:threonine dehydrogenase-like Zn-dependent dehydrogenase